MENVHCHGSGSLRPQPPPGDAYDAPYYNYGPPPPPPDVSPPGFEGFAPSPAAPAFVPGASYAAPLPLPPPRDESDATDDDDDAKDPCGALRYLGL